MLRGTVTKLSGKYAWQCLSFQTVTAVSSQCQSLSGSDILYPWWMSKCNSSLQRMLSNQKRIIFIYILTAILDLVKNICIKFSHWANLAIHSSCWTGQYCQILKLMFKRWKKWKNKNKTRFTQRSYSCDVNTPTPKFKLKNKNKHTCKQET